MSGLVATSKSIMTGEAPSATVDNDGWFPAMNLAAVRAAIRVDGTVTDERLRDALLYAMVSVNERLARWRAGHEASGAVKLEDVPSVQVGGESRLVLLYRRAVHCTVNADVMERYRNFDSSGSGERRAEDSDPAIAEQLRNVTWAIRDMLGQTHMTVELI